MISLDALYLELKNAMVWPRWTALKIWDPSQTMGDLEKQVLQVHFTARYRSSGPLHDYHYIYMARPAEFYCWAEESGIWPQADLDRCLLLVTRDLNR